MVTGYQGLDYLLNTRFLWWEHDTRSALRFYDGMLSKVKSCDREHDCLSCRYQKMCRKAFDRKCPDYPIGNYLP